LPQIKGFTGGDTGCKLAMPGWKRRMPVSEIMIPKDALVVVADGRKALFLLNEHGPLQPKLAVTAVMEAGDNPPNREQGSAAPGRVVHQSGVRGTSTVEAPDYHGRAETSFVREVAEALDRKVKSEGITAVVIVAAPRALADLRAALSPAVAAVVKAELAKDLTRHPVDQIAAAIAGP